jgi:hypothetical protein
LEEINRLPAAHFRRFWPTSEELSGAPEELRGTPEEFRSAPEKFRRAVE